MDVADAAAVETLAAVDPGPVRPRRRAVQQRRRLDVQPGPGPDARGLALGLRRQPLGRRPRAAQLPAHHAQQGTPAHIVNTASIAGLLSGVAFIGPYAATKVAVVSISETLAQELAIDQAPIGVSVLCPSSVDTRVMESERGRPAELGVEHRTEMAESVRLAIRESFTGPTGLTPAEVAGRVLDAIRTSASGSSPTPANGRSSRRASPA